VASTLREAMRVHQTGALAQAEVLYRNVLEQQPAHPDALHYLGVLLHQRGRSDEGAAKIEAALEATPAHPDAHNNLGNVHKECGRLHKAEACYRQALARAPDHHNARANLAVVLEAQERLEESFATWSDLLERAPRGAHGYWMMGRFLREHAEGMEHLEQAAECFRRAFELDNGKLVVLQDLGMVLYALGRRDDAR
jgi:tetratricopeptide (TPR) repeat protein